MKVKVVSRLGSNSREVTNRFEINNTSDVDRLIKAVVTDRSAVAHRADGKSISIVDNGCVRIEVYNLKQELVEFLNNQREDWLPPYGHTKASI